MKVPVGKSYKVMHAENSADMVKFSDTTLAQALTALNGGKIPHAEKVTFAEKSLNDSTGNKISETYAPIISPELTGTPTAPTYEGTDTTVNQIATCGYFNGLIRKVAGEVDSDMTLAKLITSINKDPNFATNFAIQLDAKQNKNSKLDSISNLTGEGIIYATGSDSFATSPISALGKNICAASSVDEFRQLAQIDDAEPFFDETENISWNKIGSPYVSSANSKFGSALQCSAGNYLQSAESVTFGGADFTIDIWAFVSSASDKNARFFSAGNIYAKFNGTETAKFSFQVETNTSSLIFANALQHLEICYKHSTAKAYVFVNGAKTSYVSSVSSPRTARQIILGGGASCSVSEIRILDGVCLHTSNFSPPTAPYDLTDKTVTLVHF